MGIGYDCGTYNIICCQRDANGEFVYKREVNAFVEISTEDPMVFNMMKNLKDANGNPVVPLMEFPKQKLAYALGEAAVRMAYTIPTIKLKRPMKDGCLNPSEKNAQFVMATMMLGMLDEVKNDKEPLYFSVPANAINEKTDSDYHSKVLTNIFKSFKSQDGKKIIVPSPINEALALIYAELGSKMYTGIGISFGAGMVNLCFAIYGTPVFQFAIVNSGDWIDEMAAKASGESVSYVNKEKEKIDLNKDPDGLVQRAIKIQYEIMIQKTVAEIKRGLETSGNKARTDDPIDIVIAGGTSSPNGFEKLFAEALNSANLSIKIGNVIKPQEPLKSVARGCLIASEANS